MVVFQSEDHSSAKSKRIPEVIVYDNSNIQKSCSGVTTPLTYHFTKRAFSSVFRQTFKNLSLSDRAIPKNEDVFQNLVGLIKGRIYYNINSWYRGLHFFHSFYHNKASLAQMMGLSEPVSFVDDEEKSWWQKCILLWGRLIDILRLLLAFSSLKTRVPAFFKTMERLSADFYKLNLNSLSVEDLKKEKVKLDKALLKQWGTPVINDLYVLMASGNVAERLEKAGVKNAQDCIENLLAEEQAYASLQPAKCLHQLAVSSLGYPELKVLINRLPDDIHQQIQVRFKEFYAEVMLFMETYGDRTTGELKLETQTMRSNPIVFYRYLRDCLNAQISEIRASNQAQKVAVANLENRLSQLPAPSRQAIMSKVAKLKQAISYRELFKLEMSKVFGMYRSLYAAFGVSFEKNGWIEKCSDIFYLTEEEILSANESQSHVLDTLIATRKQEFESYKSEIVPSRVFVSTKIINAIIKETSTIPAIQGFDSEAIKAEVA